MQSVQSKYREPFTGTATPKQLNSAIDVDRSEGNPLSASKKSSSVFQAKICGVRTESDVQAVARHAAKSDLQKVAIGLNFYPPSVRYVDPKDVVAKRLSLIAGKAGLLRIGVFVNAEHDTIRRAVGEVGLDAVQLHGDEELSFAQLLVDQGIKLVRAIKLPPDGSDTQLTVDLIRQRTKYWSAISHLLLDADAGAAHGGSGKTLDWGEIAKWAKSRPADSWTLAGGLRPENVREAMQLSSATSVDTASGVEKPKGTKHPDLIGQFLSAAGVC